MDLKTILNKHKLWLESNGTEGERAILSWANLSGANLSWANLSGADLSRANLYRADLSGANLSEANLYGANLSEANLSRANLYRANLSGANLSWANLSGADLSRANLAFTCIKGFQINRHFGYAWDNNGVITIKIGCLEHTLDHWLKEYEAIGKENNYDKYEIAEIGLMLKTLKKIFAVRSNKNASKKNTVKKHKVAKAKNNTTKRRK